VGVTHWGYSLGLLTGVTHWGYSLGLLTGVVSWFSGVYFTLSFLFTHFPKMFLSISYVVLFQKSPSLNAPTYLSPYKDVSCP
jgi:hypothetical protein